MYVNSIMSRKRIGDLVYRLQNINEKLEKMKTTAIGITLDILKEFEVSEEEIEQNKEGLDLIVKGVYLLTKEEI